MAESSTSLRGNSAWMLLGNGVFAACQWGLLALLTRLESKATVGEYVLAMTVTTPIMALCLLQLRSVQATDSLREFAFSDYLGLRLLAIGVALAAIMLVVWLRQYDRVTNGVIFAVAGIAFVDALHDVVYGLLQQRERMKWIARSLLLRGCVALVCFAILLRIGGGLPWALVAIMVCRLVILLFFDLRNVRAAIVLPGPRERHDGPTVGAWRDVAPRFALAPIWRLFRLALPLGLVMMLIVLGSNLPRFAIEEFAGKEALGVFGAIGYLSVAGTIAIGALGESASARLARSYAQGERREFLELVGKLSGIAIGLGMAGVLLAVVAHRPLLTWLYGAAYADQGQILVWMMVAAGIGYLGSMLGYSVTAARLFRAQMPLFALIVAVSAICSWWLIPAHGLFGAAWVPVITATVQVAGLLLLLAWALRRNGER